MVRVISKGVLILTVGFASTVKSTAREVSAGGGFFDWFTVFWLGRVFHGTVSSMTMFEFFTGSLGFQGMTTVNVFSSGAESKTLVSNTTSCWYLPAKEALYTIPNTSILVASF